MSRKGKLSGGEVLGWTLAGLATGLLAGVTAASWLGRGGGNPISRAIGHWRRVTRPARNISTPARSAQAALDASDLQSFGITAIGVMPGVVEIRGWVPSRAIRAKAARIAAGVPGIERVVNCILVHGEDDKIHKPTRSVADQSA